MAPRVPRHAAGPNADPAAAKRRDVRWCTRRPSGLADHRVAARADPKAGSKDPRGDQFPPPHRCDPRSGGTTR